MLFIIYYFILMYKKINNVFNNIELYLNVSIFIDFQSFKVEYIIGFGRDQ